MHYGKKSVDLTQNRWLACLGEVFSQIRDINSIFVIACSPVQVCLPTSSKFKLFKWLSATGNCMQIPSVELSGIIFD